MAEIEESDKYLTTLAQIAELSQGLYLGKTTVIFELPEMEFHTMGTKFKELNKDAKSFKIDVSGTEFIYLLDEL
jgi:hypothetical protein